MLENPIKIIVYVSLIFAGMYLVTQVMKNSNFQSSAPMQVPTKKSVYVDAPSPLNKIVEDKQTRELIF